MSMGEFHSNGQTSIEIFQSISTNSSASANTSSTFLSNLSHEQQSITSIVSQRAFNSCAQTTNTQLRLSYSMLSINCDLLLLKREREREDERNMSVSVWAFFLIPIGMNEEIFRIGFFCIIEKRGRIMFGTNIGFDIVTWINHTPCLRKISSR